MKTYLTYEELEKDVMEEMTSRLMDYFNGDGRITEYRNDPEKYVNLARLWAIYQDVGGENGFDIDLFCDEQMEAIKEEDDTYLVKVRGF